jgi:tRNA-modifying protein YgfZ
MSTFAILSDDCVINARGEETVSFLQGQLTNDIEALPDGGLQLSGYCNPKGRLFASFHVLKQGSGIDLIVPTDVSETVRKRLSMFVMRAKTKLVLNPSTIVIGLLNPPPSLVGETAGLAPLQSAQLSSPKPAVLIRLTDLNSDQRRYLLLIDNEYQDSWQAELLANGMHHSSLASWRRDELRAGITRVGAGLTEMFVPQMLNLELLGAVSFKKGCYPGQEVVARSQYLGKMKRRTFLFSAEGASTDFSLGGDVANVDNDQVEGQIVGISARDETPTEHGQFDVLIETSTDTFAAVESGTMALKVGANKLVAIKQPYEFPVHESLKRVL